MRGLGALLAALPLACAAACGRDTPAERVRDAAGLLDAAARTVLERELALLGRETGVDLHVTLAELRGSGDLTRLAAEELRRRPVLAGGPPSHAAQLLHDADSGTTRLEIGYGLGPVLPDALVGGWLDEHVRALLASGRAYEALFLTARMLQDRIRHAALDGDLDPNPPTRSAPLRFRSGGGGATTRSAPPSPDPSPTRAGSVSLATVDDAYAAYQAWLERADPRDLPDFFTGESRAHLAGWPLTPGYLEFVASREAGRAYRVLERGDRALLYFVEDPFLAPHFFLETEAGWKLDLVGEVQEVVNLSGGAWSWSFRRRAGPALEPFASAVVSVDGLRRVAGGDNRPAVTVRASD
jgi:hypothetical protein